MKLFKPVGNLEFFMGSLDLPHSEQSMSSFMSVFDGLLQLSVLHTYPMSRSQMVGMPCGCSPR